MQIPIAQPQVAPPKPPRLREQVNVEAGKAAVIGQFAQQMAQVASGFAGTMADLAAENELNRSTNTAREKWQEFRVGLQQDVEYTKYQEKFDAFYTGLNDSLLAEIHMPRAKRLLTQRLETLKIDWQADLTNYSNKRAVDEDFTETIHGINVDIVDQDQAKLNERIDSAIERGTFAKSDGEELRRVSLVQVHANILGFPDSVLWLSTEEPTSLYGISREERLSLLRQYQTEWGLLRDKEQKALTAEIERIELDYMDRLQSGTPPSWDEIGDSVLPLKRKEHYRGLINDISKAAREAEEDRLKKQREELEAQKRSEAYLQAYSEIIDWPMNQEEQVEDRILADEQLDNKEKKSLIDEYRQRNKEVQEAAQKKGPLEVTDDSTLSELICMFYDSEVPNDAVKAFIETKHGYGLSNTDTRTWLDKLKNRQPYEVYKLAIDMVSQYYYDLLKEETAESKILQSRKQEALIKKQIADEAAKGKLSEDGLLQFASNLLVEPARQRVHGWFSRMETEEEFRERTEPEVKESSATEAYEQEMIERYTAWKGSAPVSVGENEAGELVFSDGPWWYVYRRRAWYRWDGTRWRMINK